VPSGFPVARPDRLTPVHRALAPLALALLVVAALACGGVESVREEHTPEPTPPSATPSPTTPRPTRTPRPTETPTEHACSDGARFVADLNIPDGSEVTPGEPFTKTWRLENSGDCAWTRDYAFSFVEGERMGAPERLELTEEVEPGETLDLSVPFVAPMRPGTYRSTWQLSAPGGTRFGPQPYVEIVVPGPTDATAESSLEGLQESLSFSHSAAQPPPPCANPPKGDEGLPVIAGTAIAGQGGTLCLYGFGLDERVEVKLSTPDDERGGSGLFRVGSAGAGTYRTYQLVPLPAWSSVVGPARRIDGVTRIAVALRVPVGWPAGRWRAVAVSERGRATGSIQVEPPDRPTISVVPEGPINVFQNRRCDDPTGLDCYLPGEELVVQGVNFEPGTPLPLGIYQSVPGEAGVVLHRGQMVDVDDEGRFSTVVSAEASEGGRTCIVAVVNPEAERYYFDGWVNSLVACYRVLPADWPMERHDAARSGHNRAERRLTPPLRRLWVRSLGATDRLAAALTAERITASGGRVAIAGAGGEHPAGDGRSDQVWLLDGATGDALWSFTLTGGGSGAMEVAPVFSDGHVIIGGQDDADLYALDAESGEVAWQRGGLSGLYGSQIAVVGEGLYLPDEIEGIVKLRAGSGEPLWGKAGGARELPLAVRNGIAFGLRSGGEELVALNAESGETIWRFRGLEARSPWIVAGAHHVYVNLSATEVAALDAYDGGLCWRTALEAGQLGGGAALAGDRLYVPLWHDGEGNGALAALDAVTGDVLWTFSTGAEGLTGVAVANGVVYLTGWASSTVYALDADEGEVLWSSPLEQRGGDLAVADGVLFVVAGNLVYAFGRL